MTAIREGVADLVEPDRAALRLAPGKVAAIFLGMLFTQLHPTSGGSAPTPEELVTVLILARIRAAGVPYGDDPARPDNGGTDHPLCPRGLFFVDPAGNLYEVMSPSCRLQP